jgi:hypothetical protein
MAVWYSLWSFGIFPILVCFEQEKSGNHVSLLWGAQNHIMASTYAHLLQFYSFKASLKHRANKCAEYLSCNKSSAMQGKGAFY